VADGPRRLQDLHWVDFLEPTDGAFTIDGRYETVHLDGSGADGPLADLDARGARFLEAALEAATVDEGSFKQAQFRDSWMRGMRWLSTDLAETSWTDVEVVDSHFAGTPAYDGGWRRVQMYGCKLDSVNLRSSVLRDITFTDCLLDHVDFSGATLVNVRFPGSTIERVSFERAKLSKVDFSGAKALSLEGGYESLHGAIINRQQLIDLAPTFAALLGLKVVD
jgi:uncharacterized protein YjbI with pentapeptide repeats